MAENKLTLSIISFNTLGVPVASKQLTERYVTLANSIGDSTDANILAFQEVHTYVHLHLLKRFLKTFPYVVYKKALYGPKGGLVIFSKLPIVSENFSKFNLRGNLKDQTFYARLIRNGILVCKLKNHPVYILNTYFTTNPDINWLMKKPFTQIQEAQIHDLAKVITHIQQPDTTIILTGDFNFTKDSSSYALLTKMIKCTDVFAKFELPTYLRERKSLKLLWRIKFFDRILHAKESGRVDYIFLIENGKHKVAIKETKHTFDEKMKLYNGKLSYLSDHIGLYAKMELPL